MEHCRCSNHPVSLHQDTSLVRTRSSVLRSEVPLYFTESKCSLVVFPGSTHIHVCIRCGLGGRIVRSSLQSCVLVWSLLCCIHVHVFRTDPACEEVLSPSFLLSRSPFYPRLGADEALAGTALRSRLHTSPSAQVVYTYMYVYSIPPPHHHQHRWHITISVYIQCTVHYIYMSVHVYTCSTPSPPAQVAHHHHQHR